MYLAVQTRTLKFEDYLKEVKKGRVPKSLAQVRGVWDRKLFKLTRTVDTLLLTTDEGRNKPR